MFSHCSQVSFNSLGGFGALGETRIQTPSGLGVNDYYRKGTPFLLTVRETLVAPALSFDPAESARSALAAALVNAGYSVNVIYGVPSMLVFGSGGGVLEVSGFQNIDRAKGYHIRDQILGLARAAGFTKLDGVLFNIENPVASSWRVGSPGSTATWGDQNPVVTRSLPEELGLDLSGDPSFMGGSIKNLAIYGGLGLLAFFLITKAIK